MAASSELYASNDCLLWKAALECYNEVVRLKEATKKKKSTKSKEEGLVELDSWFQESLPSLIHSRRKPHLTHEELTKLMKWKLTRGKFRPRLTQLVQQNKAEDVERTTQTGIAKLPNLEPAIKELSKLKAVGPATASAILCAAAPETVPFMSDESVLSVPGLGKLDYTCKYYVSYAEKVQDKAKILTKIDKHRKWTAHDVELALWSYHFAKQLNPELLTQSKEQLKSDDDDSDDISPPPSKKQKIK